MRLGCVSHVITPESLYADLAEGVYQRTPEDLHLWRTRFPRTCLPSLGR